MSKTKNWMGRLLDNTLANILATIIITLAVSFLGGIYAFYKSNPETAWLVALTILVVINTFISILLFWQLISLAKSLRAQNQVESQPSATDLLLSGKPQTLTGDTNTDLRVSEAFAIIDKFFDEDSTPQKVKIQFTNKGQKTVYVKEIRCTSVGKLLNSNSIFSYLRGKRGDFIIPFDQEKSMVLPGKVFHIEISLEQQLKRQDVNRLSGNWGCLRIDMILDDKLMEDVYYII